MNDTIYLARLTVEAASPLGIGSGRRGLTTDRLVARDAYGLPYLPGTALAGCLRSAFTDTVYPRTIDDLFGFQAKEDGLGSRVILSAGHLVGPDGKVVGEASGMPNYGDDYLKSLTEGWLPERDHVRINSRGVADAKGHGKFDEQLVPRGVRFVFELTLHGNQADTDVWKQLVDQFSQPFFRIGGGTRKGFGKLSVVEIKQCALDLRQTEQLEAYLTLSAALDVALPPAFTTTIKPASAPKSAANSPAENATWLRYELKLKARDFFQFGAGYGGTISTKKGAAWVDKLPKREPVVTWADGKPTLRANDKAPYLLPATSLKGALSHRTAYHYNKLSDNYVEGQEISLPSPKYDQIVAELLDEKATAINDQASIEQEIERLMRLQEGIATMGFDDNAAFKKYTDDLAAAQTDEARPNVGENNDAVRALFGYAVERREKDNKKEKPQRGHVLIDDVFLDDDQVVGKTFSHVMIDRFTGGAKAGALFSEEVAGSGAEVNFPIYVHIKAFAGDNGEKIRSAFEEALLDVANGLLPLGGGVAKGHGIFTGEVIPPKKQQA